MIFNNFDEILESIEVFSDYENILETQISNDTIKIKQMQKEYDSQIFKLLTTSDNYFNQKEYKTSLKYAKQAREVNRKYVNTYEKMFSDDKVANRHLKMYIKFLNNSLKIIDQKINRCEKNLD